MRHPGHDGASVSSIEFAGVVVEIVEHWGYFSVKKKRLR
jgi:hypothetical protein